ncbi:tyrosine-type recombinase/integrase [Halomonas sp. LBP4]|uniref:tyrosine-type recombinase/integrase n=1 Tax=Halomonas sp. LBP4 TaxID=2044917 RepID=UPI000D75DFD8|nr:site-specific integrase [Halomonas sp. LBP4]PXX95371.1 integrase [Halomonas sp. LBP4]
MIITIRASFKPSKDSRLSKSSYKIPQFFENDGTPITLANRYFHHLSLKLVEKSIKTEAEHMKEFLIFTSSSGIDIESVTSFIFDSYVSALCAYTKKSGECLRWNTVNSRTNGVYRFLKWGCRRKLLPHIKIYDLDSVKDSARQRYRATAYMPQEIKSPINFLLLEDAVTFINTLESKTGSKDPSIKLRNKLIGSLMLQCGLRVSEVCEFRISQLPEYNHGGYFAPCKVIGKGGKARAVPIPNDLVLKLWEYVDFNRQHVMDNARGDSSYQDAIFLSKSGKKLTVNYVQKLFRNIGRELNFTANPHILRHTFATYHYLFNKDLPLLAKILGHESETTTHQYYVHTASLVAYSGTYTDFQKTIDELLS